MSMVDPQSDVRDDSDGLDGLPPPHDLEAEAAVLSACMLDPKRIAEVEFLLPTHFYSEAHRQIWKAALELRDEGKPCDVLQVQSRLKENKRLAQIGGSGYLTDILDAAPVVGNVRAYAMTVFERSRLRLAIGAAQRLAARGYTEGVTNVQAFVDEAAKTYVLLGRDNPTATTEKNWQVLRRLLEQMAIASRLSAEESEGRTPGLPTGLRSLDLETMGLQNGHKTTLAAESGRGKTTLAIQIAMHVAGWRGLDEPLADARGAVLFFSTEMTRDELAEKQLSHAARVDSRRLQAQRVKPTLTADEWSRVMRAMPMLEQLAIFTDDRADLTADHIVAITKQHVQQSVAADGLPLALVVLDYIQRLKVPAHLANKREDEQIGYGTQRLKELAKEEKLPVLELAQLNPPDPKISSTGRPYKWLVARCKRIEQEADHVWCLWRIKRDDKSGARITCTKQRGGDEFDLDMTFEPEYSTFYDPAYKGFTPAFGGF